MSRNDFKLVQGVAVADLLLDQGNPRIRTGHDQRQCIERILRKEEHMIALMRDIATRGLTTMPIIVKPVDEGRYVVMDGNRRVTALKLLNSPETCPDERLKPQLRDLSKRHRAMIPTAVDVMCSDNAEAIAMEVLARHSGEQGGVGQVDWSAYLRTVYLLNHGHPPDYKRAGQYALWAEDQGIFVDDEFPITSLQRFFTMENLALLGFKVDKASDALAPSLAPETVKRMAQILMTDFQTEKVKVDDVRRPEQAQRYIKTIRDQVGLANSLLPTSSPTAAAGTSGDSAGATGGEMGGTRGAGEAPAPAASTPSAAPTPAADAGTATAAAAAQRAAPTPQVPSNERNKLFGKSSPGIAVPSAETKATTIVAEIRMLAVKGDKATPLAVSMLLRHLIEISDEHYRTEKKLGDNGKLGKNVFASATHMRDGGKLSVSECDMASRLANPGASAAALLHIETLQKMMHRDTHTPSYQLLNTFWDNIAPFIRACWVK
jgi:ParB-like nuclease domain